MACGWALTVQHLRVVVTLHVDDLILSTEAPDEITAARQITQAAVTGQQEVEKAAHMVLDRGHKVGLLATSRDLHKRVQQRLGPLGGPELKYCERRLTSAKGLGLDAAVTRRSRNRWKPTRQARLVKNKLRLAQLWKLRPFAGQARVGRVFHTGSVPATTYDAELHGLSPLQARAMRSTKLSLDGLYLPGVSVEEQCGMLPVNYDPAYRATFAPLERYHREVWLLVTPHVRMQTPDALTAEDLRQAFADAQARMRQVPPSSDQLADKSARRRARFLPASPVEAAIAAANHVGWFFGTCTPSSTKKGTSSSFCRDPRPCLRDTTQWPGDAGRRR